MTMRRMLTRGFALMSAVGVGTLMIFGPSSASVREATATEAKLPSAGMAAAAPEQVIAAEEALAQADPRDVARAQAKASYAVYLMSGTLASRGVDSDKADPEALRKFMDEVAPWAEEQADRWARSLDTDAVPLEGPPAKYECGSKYGCPYTVNCAKMPSAGCYVHECGEGKCPSCPDFADLSKLAIRAWCAYTCKEGDKVVGSAALVITKPFNTEVITCFSK